MIRTSLSALILVLLTSSCAKKPLPEGITQDEMDRLVMIEFASKLEEDYHKVHPIENLSDH